MADLHPSLQIDDDWKKQAQEEKRKLAEAEAAKKSQATTAQGVTSGGTSTAAGGAASSGAGRRSAREVPQASFPALIQTLMTQALYYLGELGSRGGQNAMDLDMARMQIDLIGVLEEKTRGNLSAEEASMLDSTLYETRMRFVAVAREMVTI